jgi:hypothetical protein
MKTGNLPGISCGGGRKHRLDADALASEFML